MNSPWVLKAPGTTDSEPGICRLFCIPQAGSGAYIYHGWEQKVPSNVEIIPVELPGRNTRLRDKRFTNMHELVDALLAAITPLLDRPFAIFGHSMGGWIAFELTQRLQQRSLPLPTRLYVSAVRSPTLAGIKNDVDPVEMHKLKADAFWIAMERRYGPNPNLEDAAVRKFVQPILQADFQITETYTPSTLQPVSCGVVALGGNADCRYTKEQLDAWRDISPTVDDTSNNNVPSSSQFVVQWFDGGHNYITTASEQLLTFLSTDLHQHLLTPPPSPPHHHHHHHIPSPNSRAATAATYPQTAIGIPAHTPPDQPTLKAASISSSYWSEAGATVGSYLSSDMTHGGTGGTKSGTSSMAVQRDVVSMHREEGSIQSMSEGNMETDMDGFRESGWLCCTRWGRR